MDKTTIDGVQSLYKIGFQGAGKLPEIKKSGGEYNEKFT
jgi:hypothetical protein